MPDPKYGRIRSSRRYSGHISRDFYTGIGLQIPQCKRALNHKNTEALGSFRGGSGIGRNNV
jgi:hypothetical protein